MSATDSALIVIDVQESFRHRLTELVLDGRFARIATVESALDAMSVER